MRLFLLLSGASLLAAGFFLPHRSEGGDLPASSGFDALSPDEAALLEPGDFILRRGDSMVSSFIVRLLGDGTGFSHSGVLVNSGDGWEVIHSVSRSLSDQDGLQSESLSSFTAGSVPASTAVVRLLLPRRERAAMAEQAQSLLEKGAAFDNRFQLSSEGPLYCSELL